MSEGKRDRNQHEEDEVPPTPQTTAIKKTKAEFNDFDDVIDDDDEEEDVIDDDDDDEDYDGEDVIEDVIDAVAGEARPPTAKRRLIFV